MQHEAGLELLPQYDAYAVPIASIFYDESFNCRGPFTLQSVEDLAASIAADESLQIPRGCAAVGPGRLRLPLAGGHRRFVAVAQILHG